MSEDDDSETSAVMEDALRKSIIFKSRLYEYTMFPYSNFIHLFLRYTKNRNIKYHTINHTIDYIFADVDKMPHEDTYIQFFDTAREDLMCLPGDTFASETTRSERGIDFGFDTWMQLAEQIDIEDSQLMDTIGLSLSPLCDDMQNTVLDFIGLPHGMSWVDGFANSVRIVRKCRSQ